MLRVLLSPGRVAGGRPAWLTRLLDWLAGARRWMDRDESRRALARVDHDHLSELSEIGRQVRREERRRRPHTNVPWRGETAPGSFWKLLSSGKPSRKSGS
jgi:hypothetical protein